MTIGEGSAGIGVDSRHDAAERRLELGQLKSHTRAEVMGLTIQGHMLLSMLRYGNRGLSDDDNAHLLSWITQFERLVEDGVDETDRITSDELIAFREYFSTTGGAVAQDQLVGLVKRMVFDLNNIQLRYRFKPTEVRDDDFARFLHAARLEDQHLEAGKVISLRSMANTTKLEIETARSCLARLVDEDLGYQPLGYNGYNLDDFAGAMKEGFRIEAGRVEFRLEEMARSPSPPAPASGRASAPDEFSSISMPLAYRHLDGDLARFHQDDPFDRSVFVMMKFPDRAKMDLCQTQCLEDIYGAVKDELDRHGLIARRADKKVYATSKLLWDNLCIYMLGCRRGVAILEDHIGDELNPNVTLEYGFMKGLGREVVLLKERRFGHLRADEAGTLPKEFDIGADHIPDKQSIKEAVSDWLRDIDVGVPPKPAR